MATDTVSSSSLLKNVSRYEDVKEAAKKTKEEMGKQEFLTLFTAQLQNQNPLEPVKNEAFLAQLAQFSQLEALTNMQGSLDKFVTSMSGERMLGILHSALTETLGGSGRDLDLREPTIKLHVKLICRKLGAKNRTHAAMIARERALC